jgi:hypothetical protein
MRECTIPCRSRHVAMIQHGKASDPRSTRPQDERLVKAKRSSGADGQIATNVGMECEDWQLEVIRPSWGSLTKWSGLLEDNKVAAGTAQPTLITDTSLKVQETKASGDVHLHHDQGQFLPSVRTVTITLTASARRWRLDVTAPQRPENRRCPRCPPTDGSRTACLRTT